MKMIVTPNGLINKGLWDEACDVLGINVWAVNEGLMDSEEEIEITMEQSKQIGLVKDGEF